MKCPLHGEKRSVFDETGVWKGSKWEFVDCQEEECAWWDWENLRCAIHTIARKLDRLYETTQVLVESDL
ncbi:hypothetical protein KVG29_04910 [Caldicoprobacter algeriensis]|uniref:hypothetical protein n=1 Tax=Caldicoprobacter algeriensis TaxID=699281 RepID=UPI002079B5AB|nr:hypothetical protein [Caldicoprobacter algeriensis]MCM8900568.1 hypothetical protein [Caldicoprobacter algeriensis]